MSYCICQKQLGSRTYIVEILLLDLQFLGSIVWKKSWVEAKPDTLSTWQGFVKLVRWRGEFQVIDTDLKEAHGWQVCEGRSSWLSVLLTKEALVHFCIQVILLCAVKKKPKTHNSAKKLSFSRVPVLLKKAIVPVIPPTVLTNTSSLSEIHHSVAEVKTVNGNLVTSKVYGWLHPIAETWDILFAYW